MNQMTERERAASILEKSHFEANKTKPFLMLSTRFPSNHTDIFHGLSFFLYGH